MANYQILSDEELQSWLQDHDRWALQNGEITAQFKFKDFINAFGFIAKAALLIEKHNHHPTIENAYNKVRFSMNTHDAGNKITDRDIKLAEAIESVE